jgi:hypothetical protein
MTPSPTGTTTTTQCNIQDPSCGGPAPTIPKCSLPLWQFPCGKISKNIGPFIIYIFLGIVLIIGMIFAGKFFLNEMS